MESLMRERTIARKLFTTKSNNLEELLQKDPLNVTEVKIIFNILSEKYSELFEIQSNIKKEWLCMEGDKFDEKAFMKDSELAEEYNARWIRQKIIYESAVFQHEESNLNNKSGCSLKSHRTSIYGDCGEHNHIRRHFKLPTLHLQKFDGNVRNWLKFWGQFKKIDADANMDEDDKFQYLSQAMEPGSSACSLIESFPPSGINYSQAIQQLKNRFARDEIIIDFYVRELLNLIINKTERKINLRTLYDRLMTQIQALDTMNVTKDKYACILYPLVESTLPVETLRAWERFRRSEPSVDNNNSLQKLLDFLGHEVDSEERIDVAKNSFNTEKDNNFITQPTAACIISANADKKKKEDSTYCIFCEKSSHMSSDCFKARNMKLEEKNNLIKKNKACFKCLKKGHCADKCKSFIKCIICTKRHLAIMCSQIGDKKEKSEKGEQKEGVMLCYKNNVVMLPTVLVKIMNGKKSFIVRALVDSGSQRSYIQKDLTKNLELQPVGEELLGHFVFGGLETANQQHKLYDVVVTNCVEDFKITLRVLDEVKICGNIPRIRSNNNIIDVLKKHNILLSDVGDETIEIKMLIGSDYYGSLITNQFVNIDENLVAVKTKLGWTIQGQMRDNTYSSTMTTTNCNHEVVKLWQLETLGIRDPIEVKNQKEIEIDAMENFRNTVTVNKDNRYEVNLLWKDGKPDLQSNYKLAMNRLHSNTNRLLLTGNFEAYDNVFKEWVKLGIIEEVNLNDNVNGHYLPHHAVIKNSSLTTRIRPVFDASAKDGKGISLNSCLSKGINLIERIPNLLITFRKYALGVSSDIKRAFLQISLKPEDRDNLRFIWWRDYNKKQLIVYRHCRVVFGITCSPFLLSATLLLHLEKSPSEFKKTAEILKHSFYVDNCITSFETKEEVDKFMKEANEIMELGEFELRGWITAPLRTENTTGMTIILGLLWDTSVDILRCNYVPESNCDVNIVTKRSLLSHAQRIYDPVGFTSPITLVPKILLQKAWINKVTWDEELNADMSKEFKAWLVKLKCLNEYCLPRRLTTMNFDEAEKSLHIFCDASQMAYGAVIYLRASYNNDVSVRLVCAKARVAPTKNSSIPRLELMAALLGVRLYRSLKEELNISNNIFFWSDSMVVLTWIKKEDNWNKFVNNRVKEIVEISNRKDWYHIAGTENPADILSRGCSAETLIKSDWCYGPKWLLLNNTEWPITNVVHNFEEANKEKCKTISCQAGVSHNKFCDQLNYFSTYMKSVNMFARILRFVNIVKNKINRKNVSYYINIGVDEYMEAEKVLLKLIQKEYFIDLDKQKKKAFGITTFIDMEGVLRIKTRLTYSEDVENFKSPILLPSNNHIVMTLVRDKHRELQHAGVQVLMSNLREFYWIVGIRRLSKKVISECVICKRHRLKPVQPHPAPLPENRIKNAKAFEVTGIDLAGPLILKTGIKCWIILFTCAVYRAVHLELCLSLSTDAFLMALRRFIARRGRPEVIYSDNGTNFVGLEGRLRNVDWNEISEYSCTKKIKWRFNPPSAPWWGGWWERLIRTLKDMIRRMLGQASLDYQELETLLTDCEETMNSRPLTYVGDDPDNLKPLTPNCFLQGISNSETPDLDNIEHVSLNARLKYLHKMRTDFRSRFRSEYLSLLTQKVSKNNGVLKVGDVVLIGTEDKRIKWPLGIILEIYPGRDAHARVAKVKTSIGHKIRPFQKLYPLEVTLV